MNVTRRSAAWRAWLSAAWRATVLLAAGLALAGAETARAACIDEPVASAARLHEFEMLMMDVSLRCTRIGVEMQAHYEAMVTTHQGLFNDAARRLQSYFSTSGDARHGGLYDRYATLIANHYGGGNTSLDSCRVFDAVAVEVTRAGDSGRMLGAVAQAMVAHPVLEIATCPTQP
jgi:hypothetical protein